MADSVRSRILLGIPHGFMTRKGGVSIEPVSGLQCGFGADDKDDAVHQNRRIACDAVLPGAVLVTPYQVHSPDVVVVREPWPLHERPRADALVTDRTGLLLGIVTADCAPVLLADRDAGIIGAAHAGWRGAFDGVIERTVDAMVGLGARRNRIEAAIGPCIAQQSYEVDDEFRSRFGAEEMAFFQPGREGHWQFDLEAYVGHRLALADVSQTDPLGRDTYSAPDDFYSYRRATHQGKSSYGRQISLIGLEP